jgi:hypothetical protein
MAWNDFWTGTPEVRQNVNSLLPKQKPLLNQAIRAGTKGQGGAFGQASDYYRGLLSDESADYDAFSAPAIRQYNEDIAPGIAEQYAGMGAGGLSSSGFRNAQVQGGVDLAERLGALRAQLRNQGAQGLMNIGQLGLGNYSQNMQSQKGSGGAAEGTGKAFGDFTSAFASEGGKYAANKAGKAADDWFRQQNMPSDMDEDMNSPEYQQQVYGVNGPVASPKINSTRNYMMPNYNGGRMYG